MRFKTIMTIGTFLLLVVIICSLSVGSVFFKIDEIYRALFSAENSINKMLILEIRFPRVLMAVLVGMMLASSGVVTQAVFKNPLTDPYIIGISSSATFGAVMAYTLGLPEYYYGVFGFICSVFISMLILKISSQRENLDISNFLIIGISISAFLGALTSFMIYMIGEDSFKIVMWAMGYLGYSSWKKIFILLVPLILSSAIFYYKRYELDLLLCSDQEAISMGVDSKKLKKRLLIVSSLIVGFSVAFTGMIGFVGMIVPHISRVIFGKSNRKVLPFSMILGGIFLLISDTIARTVIEPTEIPIGVVTAFLGGPFFLMLSLKKGRYYVRSSN